ncbi:SBDS protein C-terminal domain-containing protein [Entophlyctis helioformis]|nr:SBDS protein C-terminal domain-containing protein [Entophlyctis helioformis]
MRKIQQPATSIKLTNVSIVRLRKGGKRYEVACYKNKILEWRNKLEKDIDNVLQIHQVFINVSKGQIASKEDLVKSFGTEVLNDAIMQVHSMSRDIATIVSEKSVNPETKRPYTVTMIEKALSDVHFSMNPNKSAKQQAIEAIKLLQEKNIIPIARAQMRVRVVMPAKDGKRIKEKLMAHVNKTEEEDWGDEYELICVVDPGSFRKIGDLLQEETKGRGQVEVLTLNDSTADD